MDFTRLTDAIVKGLEPTGKDRVVYEQGGLGVRIAPTGRKSFVLQARVNGQSRRFPLGSASDMSVKTARDRAAIIKGDLAEGRDPSAEENKRKAEAAAEQQRLAAAAISLTTYWQTYKEHAAGSVRPITLRTYEQVFKRYLEPALGALPVRDITRAIAWGLHGQLSKGLVPHRDDKRVVWKAPGEPNAVALPDTRRQRTANKAVQVLRLLLSDAEDRGVLPPQGNQVKGMRLPIDRERSTFLSDPEIQRVYETLDAIEGRGISLTSASFIRAMLLTGARASELQALEWAHIDTERMIATLPRGKNDDVRTIALAGAWPIIEAIPRSTGLVFWAREPHLPFVKYRDAWRIVRVKAGVPHIRLHDLRHSFASVVLAQGHSLAVIGGMLGHRSVASSKRYSHLAPTAATAIAQEAALAILAASKGGRATAGVRKRD